MTKSKSPLKDFMKDDLCLIVEPSPTFSSAVQMCLKEMGIQGSQIHISRKFKDAKQVLMQKKPKLVITEYEVDGFFGIELADMQEKMYEENSRITFITTRNSSASAIAEAAEGQVDGYLLKPFTIESFRQKLLDIVDRKLNPSLYIVKLASGRTNYASGKLDNALGDFLEAKRMAKVPTLACFYTGLTFQGKGEPIKALREFQEGRTYQPLHYKCLVGEFDTLVSQKHYTNAYKVMDLIFKNYPITSKRLGHMFVTAVFTKNFKDLPVLYNLFDQLDQKPAELIELASQALITAGKISMRQNDYDSATMYFGIGVSITRRSLKYLNQVITEFVRVRAADRAQHFLNQVSEEDYGKPAYERLSLMIDELTMTEEQIVERGRKLIFEGQGTPEIFIIVVEKSAALGQGTLAESVISKAVETHPELQQALYQIMSENLPGSKSLAAG